MLALVAVDKHGMVGAIEDGTQCGGHVACVDGDEGGFVGFDADLEMSDGLISHKVLVSFRILLWDECEDGFEAEEAQEGKVAGVRKGGAVDTRHDFCKVFWDRDVTDAMADYGVGGWLCENRVVTS